MFSVSVDQVRSDNLFVLLLFNPTVLENSFFLKLVPLGTKILKKKIEMQSRIW